MRVGILAQRSNARAAYLAAAVREALDDVEVWVDAETADAIEAPGRDPAAFDACDLVVSIGGDGTFLFASRNAGATPVLGVNLGEVGFLPAVAPDDAVAAVRTEVDRFLDDGHVRARDLPRIEATGGGWALTPALNEVVVQGTQRGHGGGLSVEVRVDGSLYTSGHADGVLVATQTGSTAYNLSEGGPLVRPGVDALVVTEMCAADAMPPLVVGLDAEITVRVDDADRAVVTSDGETRQPVEPPAAVTVTRASQPARVAGPTGRFFQALEKLE